MDKVQIETVRNSVMNEPLLEPNPSVAQLLPGIVDAQKGSIYYGTGLCTPKYLSVGLPFDVLGMILVAEKFRKLLNLDAIYHVIADTHAKSNDFCTPEDVDHLARETKSVLEHVAKKLKLEKFHVILSSEYDQTPEYQKHLSWTSERTTLHEYVKRELADILYFNEMRNMVLKIGWITQSGETPVGNDERLFDQELRRLSDVPVSFFYLKAGRTFDKNRPKASPYISIPGENRLLLKYDEPVKEKMLKAEVDLQDKTLGGAKKYLASIVRLYETTYGRIEDTNSLEDKISRIINLVCQP
ncbi:MAG: hypothetical protein WCP93_02000 [Candidatus Berkelbacteria bacterium]